MLEPQSGTCPALVASFLTAGWVLLAGTDTGHRDATAGRRVTLRSSQTAWVFTEVSNRLASPW